MSLNIALLFFSQLLIDGKVILALFTYVKMPEKTKILEWSAACMNYSCRSMLPLSSVAPFFTDEYMFYNGNAQVLNFQHGDNEGKWAFFRFCQNLILCIISTE